MTGFKNGYALIVGIANYPKVRKLSEIVLKDAQDMCNLLSSANHCGYLDSHIRLLLDSQATADGMRAGLRWLAESANSESTALIFFSGHGGRIERESKVYNYLIPYYCDPANLDGTAISGEELTTLLRSIRAQRLLVFFDSCHSGGTGETKEQESGQEDFKAGLEEDYYKQLAQGTGRVIMASSRSSEVSWILPGMKNSLFTHYLLAALQGNARTRGDGLIRVFDVFDYVSEEVPARKSQHPIFKATDLENNFPIALYLGGKQVGPGTDQGLPRRTIVDKRALREAMVQGFSLEDLDALCADVEQYMTDDGIELLVNLEMVGGNGKAGKALNLIGYLDRRGYLAYLVTAVRRARPGLI